MSAVLEVSQDKVVLDDATLDKLTNNLKYLFNIESGNNLTIILGYGHCRSNDEALREWIIDHIELNDSLNQVFDKLVSLLQIRLNIV